MHDDPNLVNEDEMCTMGFMVMTKHYAWCHNRWCNMMQWYIVILFHNKIKQKLSLLSTIFIIRSKKNYKKLHCSQSHAHIFRLEQLAPWLQKDININTLHAPAIKTW
jgi:hypothetical protein